MTNQEIENLISSAKSEDDFVEMFDNLNEPEYSEVQNYLSDTRMKKDCLSCKSFYTCDNTGFYTNCLYSNQKYYEQKEEN